MKKKVGIISGAIFSLFGVVALVLAIYYFALTETIVLDSMPAPDIQEQIEIYEELGYCMSGYSDGNSIEIRLSCYQRQKWIKAVQEELKFLLEEANSLDNMMFEISSDAKEMTLIANENMSFKSAATYVLAFVYDMELFQVLNGEEDWGIDFILIDMDTGEVLYTEEHPENNIRVEEGMWE